MSILVVDDSKFQRAATQSTLKKEGYEDVCLVGSVSEALGVLEADPNVDLVLLDIEMPDIDGIEGCRLIKRHKTFRDLPVIMLTVRDDTESLKAAFDSGAMDFISKSASPVEVATRVRSALHLKREMDRRKAKEKELLELTQKLTTANQMLRDLAVVDPLTQIPNRRYFDEVVSRDWQRAVKGRKPMSLIMIDIDYFKRYNDFYGHGQGDVCLKSVAQALSSCVRRPGEAVARYGGEEFAAVLSDTTLSSAADLAEDMRAAVEALSIPHQDSKTSPVVTVSIGVASLTPTEGEDGEPLKKAADAALYEAKDQGRNQVRTAG